MAYKLELLATVHIHPVFHVSLLKKAVGPQAASPSIPTSLSSDMELLVQLVDVLGICLSIVPSAASSEVLIHWQDLLAYEDAWEPFNVIQSQFPRFNLEDKVDAWEVGNDRPWIQVTYTRKEKGEIINHR